MSDTEVKKLVRDWLEHGVVDLFLGYKVLEGHPLPHAFAREKVEEVAELVTGPVRYPLEKMALAVTAVYPEARIGLLARDCTARALNVLTVWKQIDPDKLKPLSLTCCPSDLKKKAACSYLEPIPSGPFKARVGIETAFEPGDVEAMESGERFNRWMYEFEKCIKCYGCRNICPVCFCKECSLEHPDLISTGDLPPDVPIFHLARAVHMAGRCVDCGLCEEACPAHIPLRLLYRKVNRIVKDLFGYETGTRSDQTPFAVLGDALSLEPLSNRMIEKREERVGL